MDRRHDQVGWSLFRKLEQPFAEVGFDRRNPSLLQFVIELDLLGDHRLTLDDQVDAARLANTSDVVDRLLGR